MFTAAQNVLARARLPFVGFALLLYAISVPVAALRWRAVLRGLDQRLPLGRLVLVNLAGVFVNNVTPARAAGELCRIVALTRMRLNAVTSAASVGYERLSELPAVVALVLVATLSLPRAGVTPAWTLTAAVVVVALVAIGVLHLLRVGGQWTERLRAVRIAPSALVASAAISVLLWTLDVVRLRIAAATMRAPIGLTQAAALSAITVAAGWVPTIGGLGAIEGGMVGGLIAFGVTPVDAAAVTAIERAISYGVATIAGAGALSLLGGRSLWNAARRA